MAIAFAVIAATGSAAAQPPEAATHSTPPLAYPYAILPVDIHAATLRGQPNMHGIGVMTGPDGHPRVFCVDPSEPDQAFRLHRNMQAGVDAVRYQ